MVNSLLPSLPVRNRRPAARKRNLPRRAPLRNSRNRMRDRRAFGQMRSACAIRRSAGRPHRNNVMLRKKSKRANRNLRHPPRPNPTDRVRRKRQRNLNRQIRPKQCQHPSPNHPETATAHQQNRPDGCCRGNRSLRLPPSRRLNRRPPSPRRNPNRRPIHHLSRIPLPLHRQNRTANRRNPLRTEGYRLESVSRRPRDACSTRSSTRSNPEAPP